MNGPTNNERSSLDARLDRAEFWTFWSGFAVFVGLFVEYVPPLMGAQTNQWPYTPLLAVGGMLVTIGVGGEVALGARIARLTKRLQEIADREIAETNERAAKAELATEELRARNLELEAIVAPRNVEVTNGAIERLAMDAGTVLHIEYLDGDNEARNFAKRIATAVRWADWEARVAAASTEPKSAFGVFLNEVRSGVEIRGSEKLPNRVDFSKLPRNRAAMQLWHFLLANGIDANLYIDAGFLGAGKPIIVSVWSKPTPHSKRARREGLEVMGLDPSIPRTAKEHHDAAEKALRESSERLKKEWYPDGEP